MILLLRMLGEGNEAFPRPKSAALWSFPFKYLKRHLHPLKFIKSLPFCANTPVFCLCFSCRRVAKQPQQSNNKADGFTVRSTSLRRHIPSRGAEVCQEADPSHRRSWRLYTSSHGRCLRGNGPSRSSPVHAASLPLLSCSVKVWPRTQRGPIYHL